MIGSIINEITVFADKLEDEGTDISLLRYLCSYNYLSSLIVYLHFTRGNLLHSYIHSTFNCGDGFPFHYEENNSHLHYFNNNAQGNSASYGNGYGDGPNYYGF